MESSEYDFDLAVIGSGPGGQKAAIMAAKLGKRVCVIDGKHMVGGVCVNTGTIPSKTLREAVLYLTGMQQRDMYGASYRVKNEITISDLLRRTQHVIGREVEVVRNQLLRNHVELMPGHGQLPRPAHAVDRRRRPGDRAFISAATRSSSPPAPRRPARAGRLRRRTGARLRPDPRPWTRCPTRWSWSEPG